METDYARHQLDSRTDGYRNVFLQTLSVLSAADGAFRPQPDMYTVSGHLHHVATTITWFIDGAFRGWMALTWILTNT